MPITKRILLTLWIVMGVVACFLNVPADSASREVTVAVVRDGPSHEDMAGLVEAELQLLLPRETVVRFKEDPAFDAKWSPDLMRKTIQNALNDASVDIVLLMGVLTTQEASRSDFMLTKPVVSAAVQMTDMFVIPLSEGKRNLKKNLSVILVPQKFSNEVDIFQKIFPFEKIHVLVEEAYIEQLDFYRKAMSRSEEGAAEKVALLPLTDDPDETLSKVGADVRAVALTRLPRLSSDGRTRLISGFNERGIPTFSLFGHSDVERGALAGVTPDIAKHVARRAAMNINQIIRGTPVGDLPIFLVVHPKLLINGRTAAEIGYVPNYEARTYATFLYEEELYRGAQPLSFVQALQLAEEGNVSLTIKDSQVESTKRAVGVSRSYLLPQISAGASYQYQDPRMLKEIMPEEQSNAGVSMSQMIYDDRAVSDFRSSKRLYEGIRHERESERLNVISNAGRAFLDYVLSRLLYNVNLSTLRLTEENLELARLREEVGYSGKDEVFRWQAELAKRRSTLFLSESNVEAARISFNQILGIDQSTQWIPEEVVVDSEKFSFLDGRLDNVFRDAIAFDKFREFMVTFAMGNSPEIKLIDKAIDAQDIQLGQRKRLFFLPTFVANFSYDYQFERSPEIAGIDKDEYRFEIAALYPIFNGGRRYYDMKRIGAELETLRREKNLVNEIVERRTRTAVRRVENSFPVIRLGEDAAENARKNLVVVQDKYSQGIVNVTDLLEAQNESFIADQNAAISVYSYLKDLVELQRAVSWLEDEKTIEEKDAVIERIQAAVQ